MRFSTLAAVSAAALASSIVAHPFGGYDYDVSTRGIFNEAESELIVRAAGGKIGVPAPKPATPGPPQPKSNPPPGVPDPRKSRNKRSVMNEELYLRNLFDDAVDQLVARAGAGVPSPGPQLGSKAGPNSPGPAGPIRPDRAGPQGRYSGPKPKQEGVPPSLKMSANARRDTDIEEIVEIIARGYHGDYEGY